MPRSWSYASRLASDLDRWRAAGFITEVGQRQILADMSTRASRFSLPGTLAVLGAVLIGFSAMSFVAANWSGMSKLARLLVLAAGMWSAYGTAAVLFARQLPMFGHAAVLGGASIFGAAIMLVAQMYHMDGNPPDAVLLWAAGALAAGIGFASGPVLGLAMALVGLWSGWEMLLTSGVHWAFLLAWAAVAGTFLWLRWRPGLHLSALTLAGWIVALAWKLPQGPHSWLVAAIGFAIAVLAVASSLGLADALSGRVGRIAPTATNYGLLLGFTGLMMMQTEGARTVGQSLGYALVMLAIVLGVIAWAMRSDNRPALWVAYGAFSAEILLLYFRTLGTLLNTSLFFAVAGLLVIALSTVAFRLLKRDQALVDGVRP